MKIDKSKNGNTPRTIVCRILNHKGKIKILRNAKKLKGKKICINEGFCQATLDYRKKIWKEVKCLREKGKIAYLQYKFIAVKMKGNTG